ncbi:hypothetical protein ACFOGI_09880 [Virgibacillus xinjiangensis]|uniref:PepSY domain-containing protein n=1 Tax=Virgibacillus xinjiangensis TaxID=393090 RepID=A0ABV7CW30_9BACI
MENLSRGQAVRKLNDLLGENIEENFTAQEKHAGEHGHSSFLVTNQKGATAEVGIDWDKEADELIYSVKDGEETKH